MHVITIATNDYFIHAGRLARSLRRQHPEAELSVYLEDESHFARVRALGAIPRLLPEIGTLGVKRAKFVAYRDAIGRGSFLYLDADVIVLGDLYPLVGGDAFTACRDDLSECTCVPNPKRPWSSRPALDASRYFNSGVFFAPGSLCDAFRRWESAARDDAEWTALTIENCVADNHFLCGKIAEEALPVKWASELEYNWQGFRRHGRIVARVEGGELVNEETGDSLRLVHFAGIRDIDGFLLELPSDVLAILARATADEVGADIMTLFGSKDWWATDVLERDRRTLLSAALRPTTERSSPAHLGFEDPYVSQSSAVVSIATSVASSEVVWNGLACGAAYLSAQEYVFLRQVLRATAVKAVVEIGAGYSSVLFAREVPLAIAVEGLPGPWLDFARAHGCDARHIPFAQGFDNEALGAIERELRGARGRKLVFLDSPQGTRNRRVVAEQLVKHFRSADLFVVHDARRDAEVVYFLAKTLGARIVATSETFRELVVLARDDLPQLRFASKAPPTKVEASRMRLFAKVMPAGGESSDARRSMQVRLRNDGLTIIPFRENDGFLLSYHLIDGAGATQVWDGPRFLLPCDLAPGDELLVRIPRPAELRDSDLEIQVDLVREGEYWLSEVV